MHCFSAEQFADFLSGFEPTELGLVCRQIIRAQEGVACDDHPVLNEMRLLFEEAESRGQSPETLRMRLLQAPALAELLGPEVADSLRQRLP